MLNVAINHAGYHCKNQQETTSLQVFFFVLSSWPVSPSGIYGLLFLMLNAANDNKEKENTTCVQLLA